MSCISYKLLRIATDMEKIVLPELSYQIIGACFDAFNEIGGGQKEKYYQKAVGVCLKARGVRFEEQVHCPLLCDGQAIGRYYLDFLVNDQIVLELKVGNRFRRQNYDQVKQYLVEKDRSLGILVRFDHDSVLFQRVLKPSRHSSVAIRSNL